MYVNIFGFLEKPASNQRDSWRYSIFYSPVGNVTFPIPGIAYMWNASDTLNASIGIPFLINWKPIEDLTLSFAYVPVININARATYRLKNGLEFYGAFEWLEEAYFLAESTNRDDRFLAFEMDLIGGLRWEFRANAVLEFNSGYAFNRFYGRGDNIFSNLQDEVNVNPGGFHWSQA